LCALFGGLCLGGMLCRLFLTPGDAYAPLFPTAWVIPAVCFGFLLGYWGFRCVKKAKLSAFAVLVPLLWLTPLRLLPPFPELLAAILAGGALALFDRAEQTLPARLLLTGSAVAFCLGAWFPPLCGRLYTLGMCAAAVCGAFRVVCHPPLKYWRYPLVVLMTGSALLMFRRGGDFFSVSLLPPPPLFAASLMPAVEDKVEILLVSDRLRPDEKPLDSMPYVERCTVLSWRDFATLCSTGVSAQYDLVALDAAPGHSGKFKCEALRQGLCRTRKGGGVLVYPGFGRRTPIPDGAVTAVSLPWDDNRYFAAAVRTNLTTDQEKLDDRLQQYQNAFGFELFPAGVFTAIYHGTHPQITLQRASARKSGTRPLPAGWWRFALAGAAGYGILRLLLCRRERFGAVFAAQENAVSFGLVVFAAILQGGDDFFSPVPGVLLFGVLFLPLLAFRTTPGKGVLMLAASWLLPVCWLFPRCAGDWRISVAVVLAGTLGAGYSCFRQNRPGWTSPGSTMGEFLTGVFVAAVLTLVLYRFQLPLLPLAAAGNLILRAGVTLRS